MGRQLPRRVIEGTGGKILELLRQGARTVDEIASALNLTRTAVRAQLATLERDELVERRGSRRGPSKPAGVYGITMQAELLFSRAYIPILTQLLHVLAHRLGAAEFDSIMYEVGRRAMSGRAAAPHGPLRDRVATASTLLNELGGLSEVDEEDGLYIIRSHGCPLAAATAEHPEACNALESMLSEFVGTRVTKCCDRYDRVRCCFEVARDSGLTPELQH
ncbi:MAG TPA: ArsR family transcriptional regulator [Gemmatimonadales bacterium]|nr:ArsR family transcriptional regulator [Gemmatimonadales bacterium]